MDRKPEKLIAAIIFLALLGYLGVFLHGLFTPQIRLLPDSYEYLQAAGNLLDHGTFYAGNLDKEIDFSLYSRRPPGYPVLLMLLSLLSSSLSLVAAFQVLLVFTGGFMLWDLNRKMEVPPRANAAALAIYFFYPGQLIYSQMIMAEIVLQFLLLASAWFLIRFLRGKTASNIVMLNCCLAAAVLCKPVMLYFWIPNLLLHVFLYRRFSLKVILVAALLPLAATSAWSWRNYQLTGVYHYSSMKVTHMKFSLPDPEEGHGRDSGRDFAEDYRKTEASSIRKLLNPAQAYETMISTARKTASFFVDPGRFDIYRFVPIEGQEKSTKTFLHWNREWKGYFQITPNWVLAVLGILLLLNIFVLIAFLLFPFIPGPDIFLRLFLTLLVFYNSLVVGYAAMGTARYRLTVEPLLIAGAVAALSFLSQKHRLRKRAASGQ